MYNTVSELNIERFENYHDEYEKLSGVKKNKYDQKFNPIYQNLKDYNYDWLFTKDKLDHEEELVTTRERWRCKRRNKIKNLDSKQIIN